MKKVSKKVVKETTKNKMTKTTTTVFESKCGCDNFECIHELVDGKDFTKNGDSYHLSEDKNLRKGNKQINLSAKLTLTPVKADGKNHNIIRTERVITEEITTIKTKGNATQSDISSVLESLVKEQRQPTANEINKIAQHILSGAKLPDNIKVMRISGMKENPTPFPSFEEFVKMITKPE